VKQFLKEEIKSKIEKSKNCFPVFARGFKMSIYPTAIPDDTNYPNKTNDVDWIYAALYNDLKEEVLALCKELGISPSGASATLVARLALLATKASPTFTGEATIPTIDLTGGQIKFPATAVPSADPNTIDAYKEHTWTPVYSGSTGSIGATAYSTQIGHYTKIGNIVFASGTIILTNNGDWTGSVYITGLPFTSADNDEQNMGSVWLDKVTFVGQPNVRVGSNQSFLVFRCNVSGSDGTYIATADVPDNGIFRFSIAYLAG